MTVITVVPEGYHANPDISVGINAVRYSLGPVTCLYCSREITGRPFRGCCTAACASLEHDYEPPETDPED